MEPPHPGAVVVNNSYDQLANGLFHNISYLIGFNSMEAIPIVSSNNLMTLLISYKIEILLFSSFKRGSVVFA